MTQIRPLYTLAVSTHMLLLVVSVGFVISLGFLTGVCQTQGFVTEFCQLGVCHIYIVTCHIWVSLSRVLSSKVVRAQRVDNIYYELDPQFPVPSLCCD